MSNLSQLQHQARLVESLIHVNENIKEYKQDCSVLIGCGLPEGEALKALQEAIIDHARTLKDIFKIV